MVDTYEVLFNHLDELDKLEKIIVGKQRKRPLNFADPDVMRYKQVREKFLRRFMPKDEEDFIGFVRDVKGDYERWLEGGIEEVRDELEPQIRDLKDRLKNIANAVAPFIYQINNSKL